MWAFLYQHSVITFSSRYFCQSHFSRPPLFLSVSSSLSLRLASALLSSFKLNEVLRWNAMGCSSCVCARESAGWARSHALDRRWNHFTRAYWFSRRLIQWYHFNISYHEMIYCTSDSLSLARSPLYSFRSFDRRLTPFANCKFPRAPLAAASDRIRWLKTQSECVPPRTSDEFEIYDLDSALALSRHCIITMFDFLEALSLTFDLHNEK